MMDIGEFFRQQLKHSMNQQFHIEGDIWLVPCVANYSENDFKPLLKPISSTFSTENQGNKLVWTTFEDEILLKIVLSRGTKAWSAVAKELNTLIHEGYQVRKGRNCRERWHNHVDPELIKGSWTAEEDQFIITQQGILGNRWSEISKKLHGRTENSVKNRFNSLMRKKISYTSESQKEDEKCSTSVSPNFNPTKLMSPDIANYGHSESPELPLHIVFRPMKQKLHKIEEITRVKKILKNETGLDLISSPFSFFR